jgi:hypothetical protein
MGVSAIITIAIEASISSVLCLYSTSIYLYLYDIRSYLVSTTWL